MTACIKHSTKKRHNSWNEEALQTKADLAQQHHVMDWTLIGITDSEYQR